MTDKAVAELREAAAGVTPEVIAAMDRYFTLLEPHAVIAILDSHDLLAARVVELEGALGRSMTALNDWLCTYASDFCGEEAVAAARERISELGTIGYIATVQDANRLALAAHPQPGAR